MNCQFCGRNLQLDSRYCDFCGTKIPEVQQQETESKIFDINLLLKWILISIAITVAITLIAKGAGIPIFFGGLFLPFFFKKKTKNY